MVCVRACLCVWVCVPVPPQGTFTFTISWPQTNLWGSRCDSARAWVCVCVCVCLCWRHHLSAATAAPPLHTHKQGEMEGGVRQGGRDSGGNRRPLWRFNIQLAASQQQRRQQAGVKLSEFIHFPRCRHASRSPPDAHLDGHADTHLCNFPAPALGTFLGGGRRGSGTACKYVLWRRRSCGFWRRSSLWSSVSPLLSPGVCSAPGPPPGQCLSPHFC